MTWTAPPETITFDGVLFDMDGTVIDSTAAVEKHWHLYVDKPRSVLHSQYSVYFVSSALEITVPSGPRLASRCD